MGAHQLPKKRASIRPIQSTIDEVVALFKTKKVKMRMEKEFELAQRIQKFFFPEEHKDYSTLEVSTYSGAATECRGDWLYHTQIDNRFYVMIADATGHGIGPALLTSAVRASFTILEKMPNMEPAQILGLLNETVYQSAMGEVCMTFFIAAIDLKTGVMEYANASHEPPYLLRSVPGAPAEAEFLSDIDGPSLGTAKFTSYAQHSLTLKKDDVMVLLTDGIFNFAEQSGRHLTDRQFLKMLVKEAVPGASSWQIISAVKALLANYEQAPDNTDDSAVVITRIKTA